MFMIKNLRIWVKLFIICLAFLVPTALLMYYFIDTRDEDIDFSKKEWCGDQYNRQLMKMLQQVQKHKIEANRHLSGVPASRDLMASLESQIEGYFTQLESIEKQTCINDTFGADLQTTKQFEQLKVSWANLKNNSLSGKAPAGDELHRKFIDELSALYSSVGDSSNLILDPDLDTYYIMDATLIKLPDAAKRLEDIISFGEGILRRRELTPDERADLIAKVGTLEVNLADTEKNINVAYKNNTYYEKSKGLKEEIDGQMLAYLAAVHSFLDLVRTRILNTPAVTVQENEFLTIGATSLESLFRFYDAALAWLDKGVMVRSDNYFNEKWAVVSLVVAVILIAIVLVYFIIRGVNRPLQRAVSVSNQLSQGNLTAQIDVQSTDETGQLLHSMKEMLRYLNEMAEMADRIAGGDLAVKVELRSGEDRFGKAFQKMVAYLNEMAGVADRIAAGDLSAQVALRSSQDTFGNALRQMTDKLRELTNDLKTTTTELANAGGQIVAASRRTLQTAQNQAAAVQESTSSASELQETSRVTGDRAKEIQRVLERTVQSSQTIRSQIGDTASAMGQIQEQIRVIVDSIRRVAEKNVQIGEIIESVGELADQSQLLAINAGIEAAKAGDSGKGFSVVASEMKALADQSKNAARRIRSIVSEVRKGADDAASIAETGQGRFRDSMDRIHPVLEQVEELTLRVDESNQAVQQILAIVNQQIIGVEQITEAMRMIQDGVQEGVTQNQQLEKAAESLNSVGLKLRTLVEAYRL